LLNRLHLTRVTTLDIMVSVIRGARVLAPKSSVSHWTLKQEEVSMNILSSVVARLPHVKCRLRKIKFRYDVNLFSGDAFVHIHVGRVALYVSKPTHVMPPSMPFISMWR
jgi:hypothetical protein